MFDPSFIHLICAFLLALNVAAPLFVIWRFNVTKGKITVDHVLLFSLGYLFYWIIPAAFGFTDYVSRYKSGANWYSYFDKINNDKLVIYLLLCFLFYAAFAAGSLIKRCRSIHLPFEGIKFDKRYLNIFLVAGIVAGLFFAYPLRHHFFTGYKVAPLLAATGPFTAITIFMLSLALLYTTRSHDEPSRFTLLRAAVFNRYFLTYAVFASLLVSLGGRSILIASILMLFVFYTVYIRPVRMTLLLLVFVLIIVGSHLIIIFRTGAPVFTSFFGSEDSADIFLQLFSDTVNISYSLFQFLYDYSLPLLKFPEMIISGLFSLIPSFILPSKDLLMKHPADIGYEVFSPQGGVHSFVYLVINFGVFGTVMFLFSFSFLLREMKMRQSYVWRTSYILISGWLAISIFRDFQTSLLKMMLEFSVLEPFIIALSCAFLTKISERRTERT
jgi:hypothetical protein